MFQGSVGVFLEPSKPLELPFLLPRLIAPSKVPVIAK